MLLGRGTAYVGPITRRIPTTGLQNPKFFRPELRSGLKQRQEVSLHMVCEHIHPACFD
jgi:hypothetical protein